jgi:hypothetical protein
MDVPVTDQKNPFWMLKGGHEAPGWGPLEQDARAQKLEVVLFDRDAWALVRAATPPTQYEGLVPMEPPAGLYLDNQGRNVYIADGKQVAGPREVLASLGEPAQDLLRKLGDPDIVLERLGRAY